MQVAVSARVTAAMAFALTACSAIMAHAESAETSTPGCDYRTLAKDWSPDGSWVALVEESFCSNGAYTTTVINAVRLVRPETAPRSEGVILVADVGGDDSARPIIRWRAPDILEIRIPARSLLGRQEHAYDGVRIIHELWTVE